MAQPRVGVGQRASSRAAVEQDVRRLVARELHDRVAQTLTGMLIDLENFKTEPVAWDDVLRHLDTIQDSTRYVLTNLRQLLYDLRGEEVVGDHLDFLTARLVHNDVSQEGYELGRGVYSASKCQPACALVLGS